MPISPITLQRRHAELGRIRLGNQVSTQSGKTRPNKLEHFRFTSASEQYVRDLAELYGGEARQWDNGGKPEWEVYSEAKSIPVIVVKGGLSQWMETWSGGGCVHRCDGVHSVEGFACQDDPNPIMVKIRENVDGQFVERTVRAHDAAKPTTRLSVMLPELEAIGVWRMESHGWNSAAEIPAVAELAQFVGELVPAHLHLVERRTVKDGQTSRFVVPILDLHIGAARLREIVAEKSGQALPAGSQPELEQGQRAAIEAPRDGRPDYLAQAQECSTVEAVKAIWYKAKDAGHMSDLLEAELKKVADSLANAAATTAQQPDAEGVYDADVVEEAPGGEDADAVWQQILLTTGQQGMSLTDTQEAYQSFSGGTSASVASAAELQAFLTHLRGERVSA